MCHALRGRRLHGVDIHARGGGCGSASLRRGLCTSHLFGADCGHRLPLARGERECRTSSRRRMCGRFGHVVPIRDNIPAPTSTCASEVAGPSKAVTVGQRGCVRTHLSARALCPCMDPRGWGESAALSARRPPSVPPPPPLDTWKPLARHSSR